MATPLRESQHSQGPLSDSAIRFVCISDTHNAEPAVPPGDVLVHAGDLTQHGTVEELQAAVLWISSLPHAVEIVIAGNHDKVLDAKYRTEELLDDPAINWESAGIIYLEHTSTQITVLGRTLTVFGSPQTPEFGAWAFQYPPAHLIPEPARCIWSAVPLNTDVLITHGPPFGHLDTTGGRQAAAGCRELLHRLQVVKPALHVFGHIHAGQGREVIVWNDHQSGLGIVSRSKVWLDRLLPMIGTRQRTRSAR